MLEGKEKKYSPAELISCPEKKGAPVVNRMGNTPGLRRWRGRTALLAASAAASLVLLAASGHLSFFGPSLETRRVTLTGKNATGQIEVPVLNLWAQPGFGPEKKVQSRISLPPAGEVKARLLAREEVQGLSWYKVRVNGETGWVLARFVL